LCVLSLLLVVLGSSLFAASTSDTNLDVMDNNKYLFGEKVNGADVSLIGVNTSDTITIDSGAVGVALSGTLSAAGDMSADADFVIEDIFELDPKASVDTSATTNATLTLTGSNCFIDTHQNVAISTVNSVATANWGLGSRVEIQSNISSHDVVFIETNNLNLGATSRTLSDTADKIILEKYAADDWREIGFFDNN